LNAVVVAVTTTAAGTAEAKGDGSVLAL